MSVFAWITFIALAVVSVGGIAALAVCYFIARRNYRIEQSAQE